MNTTALTAVLPATQLSVVVATARGLVAGPCYLVGFTANGWCIVSILLHCDKWWDNPGNTIILSLAVADSVHCFTGVMMSLASVRASFLVWDTAEAYIYGWLMNLSWSLCTFHINLMAINRAVGMLKPMLFAYYFDAAKTRMYVLATWALCVVYSMSRLTVLCCALTVNTNMEMLSAYEADDLTILMDGLISMYTLVVPSVLYLLITARIHKSNMLNAASGNDSIQLRLCVQFALILLVYIIMSGHYILDTAGLLDADGEEYDSGVSGYVFASFNHGINPLIYLLFNPTIRNAMKRTIRCGS